MPLQPIDMAALSDEEREQLQASHDLTDCINQAIMQFVSLQSKESLRSTRVVTAAVLNILGNCISIDEKHGDAEELLHRVSVLRGLADDIDERAGKLGGRRH